MDFKTRRNLAAAIMATAWIAGFLAAAESGIKELRWIPANARLLMIFDRPAGNEELFARLRDEILFATDTAGKFQDFIQLIGAEASRGLERIVIAAVTRPEGRDDEVIGVVRGSIGEEVLSRLTDAGKLVSRPYKGRSVYVAGGNNNKRNIAVVSLDENHAVFGTISAIERVLALPGAESALHNR